MKIINKTFLVVTIALSLSAVTAHAGKPSNPPKDSGRAVIGDAATICLSATDADVIAACALAANSNGKLIDDGVCDFESLGGIVGDSGIVEYQLRNCDKNEAAQVRAASSAVLSLDDVYTRGKEAQRESAAGYLCAYADKYDQLGAAMKLFAVDVSIDLGEDARDLADVVTDIYDYCSL